MSFALLYASYTGILYIAFLLAKKPPPRFSKTDERKRK
jgi:hypothetical protein